jgi:hypothetical protein
LGFTPAIGFAPFVRALRRQTMDLREIRPGDFMSVRFDDFVSAGGQRFKPDLWRPKNFHLSADVKGRPGMADWAF